MKKLNWNKLPERELNQNPHAFWTKARGSKSQLSVNFTELEDKFSQKQAESKGESDNKPAKVSIIKVCCALISLADGHFSSGWKEKHGHQSCDEDVPHVKQ